MRTGIQGVCSCVCALCRCLVRVRPVLIRGPRVLGVLVCTGVPVLCTGVPVLGVLVCTGIDEGICMCAHCAGVWSG